MKVKFWLLITLVAIISSGCGRYLTTSTGRKYRISKKEFRIEQRAEYIQRCIEKQLGISQLSDSIWFAPDCEEVWIVQDSITNVIDSVFESQYVFRDTIGETRRYNTVFSKPMQKAIESYLSFEDYPLWIKFFRKSDADYFYIMPAIIIEPNADGFALYQNRIQISVFDYKKAAKKVIPIHKMRNEPYDRYLPIGNIVQMTYDGPIDVYKISNKGEIEFIGRGYLDKEWNFIPALTTE